MQHILIQRKSGRGKRAISEWKVHDGAKQKRARRGNRKAERDGRSRLNGWVEFIKILCA